MAAIGIYFESQLLSSLSAINTFSGKMFQSASEWILWLSKDQGPCPRSIHETQIMTLYTVNDPDTTASMCHMNCLTVILQKTVCKC